MEVESNREGNSMVWGKEETLTREGGREVLRRMEEGKITVRPFEKLTKNHTLNHLYKIPTIHTN